LKLYHLILIFLFAGNQAIAQQNGRQTGLPNVIVIFADDLGYGDLGCYGHPTIKTPHLDQMAREGMLLTQFYVGANVCTPSRAALLTGRLPVRYGLTGGRGVFFPNSAGGLPENEITIARALKSKGYKSGIIGKWHLGHMSQYLPTSHGFDYYFGLPYSNDMIPRPGSDFPPLPLYRNDEIIERGVDQRQLTKRYTEEAIEFIRENRDGPFFLYYPNNFPHVPLYASEEFRGKSERGLYGDVVEELDWSVGQVLKTLKELKLEKNTLVIFTSDNGPWLQKKENGGSGGLLYEGKGSAYEGGMRVPAIAWWPGVIEAGQASTALATTMDLYPTILNLADVELPQDRKLDGMDILPVLKGEKEVREVVYYYHRSELYAVRKGPWKAHFITRRSYSKEPPIIHEEPLLFHVEHDPSEQFNVSKKHPQIISELTEEFEKHKAGVTIVPTQLKATIQH
jgi:arylsulfatase A